MAGMDSFVDGSGRGWKDMGEGRRLQLLAANDQMMMVRWSFEVGAVGAPHSHPHVQTAFIESGRFEVTIGERTETLGPGSSYAVEGGLVHGVVCIEAGAMVDAFSPMRDDLLAAWDAEPAGD